jgi:DNA-binding MarR family transcriptional regulator
MASRTNPSSATAEERGLWKALIRVSQLLPAALDRELRTVGESLTRYEILAMLSGCPDGVQMSELGRLALVSKPRLSVHVAELESQGLVDRRQDPDDGRATIITLTAAGRRDLAKLSPAHEPPARARFACTTTARSESVHPVPVPCAQSSASRLSM